MNRLSREKSAYLRHASNQKIDWYPWSEHVFEIARESDRPVFLSSGAVWCHWCHVMARECFYDEEISDLLGNYFISIKLDRDERPDIDRRYQLAVAAMGSGGGWPLTVFLTPEKVPFFGGTYFPPEDRMGRPGFKKVLKAVSELYQSKKDEISEYTENLMKAIRPDPLPRGEINESRVHSAVSNVLSQFDPQNGGFGTAPKFPMPGAIDFLLNRFSLSGGEPIEAALRKTLDAMTAGGFYDHIGGGFHRYSTDEAWIVPHFEKMADDNAWLLKNYLSAYAVFGEARYRETSEGIITFVQSVLSHPEGGFYASQDADVTPDDEGGYFTWTDEDFRRVLDDEEYRILSLLLLHDAGSMHHDRTKKVLFMAEGVQEIAKKCGKGADDVMRIIRNGKDKLLKERNKRVTPFVDTTLYTSINGMMISVFLFGFRILKDPVLKDFALRSLDKIMAMHLSEGRLYHTQDVAAMLEDYAYLIDALLAAYEVTGSTSYVTAATELMDACISDLWDESEGGFFDSKDHLLGMSLKAVEDIPHPSSNALCIRVLLKLYSITGEESFRRRAEDGLNVFSVKANEIGIHAGYYFSALDAWFHPLKLTLYSEPDSSLSREAVSLFIPHIDILYEEDRGYIVPCVGEVCYEPVHNSEALKKILHKRESKVHKS